jgi:hypothetical protein
VEEVIDRVISQLGDHAARVGDLRETAGGIPFVCRGIWGYQSKIPDRLCSEVEFFLSEFFD